MHAINNPLSLGNRGLRVVLSGHFCANLHVGHARRIRPIFDYRITDLEAQIKKTNKTTNYLRKAQEITFKGKLYSKTMILQPKLETFFWKIDGN